jgi:hypothetical protein
MKKVLLVVLALLISVAFVTTVFAQSEKAISSGAAGSGQPQKPMTPGAKDTGAPVPSKAVSSGAAAAGETKAKVFKGEVVSVDAAAKTLVVKDKKGEKTFENVKKMADLKAGDKVSLQYAEKDGKLWAANVQKAGAKAPAKTEATGISSGAAAAGEGKPAPKPAPAPAPAK